MAKTELTVRSKTRTRMTGGNSRANPKKPGELASRVATAVLAGAVLIALIVYSSWGLLACGAALSAVALVEYYRLAGLEITAPGVVLALLLTGYTWAVAAVSVHYGAQPALYYALALPALPLAGLFALFSKAERATEPLGVLTFGYLYVTPPFVLLYLGAFDGFEAANYDYHVPLGILMLHWSADTAAYFAGKAFGKRPLFPSISPKKTWEGFVGGLLANIALGFLLEQYWHSGALPWLFAAPLVAVTSVLGDLLESRLKREAQVKDSGGVLPGHGGALDRFDGFLFSMPCLFLALIFP